MIQAPSTSIPSVLSAQERVVLPCPAKEDGRPFALSSSPDARQLYDTRKTVRTACSVSLFQLLTSH